MKKMFLPLIAACLLLGACLAAPAADNPIPSKDNVPQPPYWEFKIVRHVAGDPACLVQIRHNGKMLIKDAWWDAKCAKSMAKTAPKLHRGLTDETIKQWMDNDSDVCLFVWVLGHAIQIESRGNGPGIKNPPLGDPVFFAAVKCANELIRRELIKTDD
jgi:hypothetical protein